MFSQSQGRILNCFKVLVCFIYVFGIASISPVKAIASNPGQRPGQQVLSIQGRAIDADTGKGLEGVPVYTTRTTYLDRDHTPVITDAEGLFEVSVEIREGKKNVSIWSKPPPGYWQNDIENVGFYQQRIIEGMEPFITLTYTRGAILPIQVISAKSGQSIQGVRVEGPHEFYRPGDIPLTDSSGRVEIVIPIGRQIVLEAAHGMHGRASHVINASEVSTLEEVIFSLSGFATVSGHVYGPSGDPLQGIEVTRKNPAVSGKYLYSTTTDKAGRFELRGLEPGGFSIFAVVPRHSSDFKIPDLWYGFGTPEAQNVILAGNEKATGLDFHFTDSNFFQGYIKNNLGKPIANAKVSASVGSENTLDRLHFERVSDDDGSFQIPISFEKHSILELTITHAEYYQTKPLKNLSLKDSPLDISMNKMVSRRIRVVNPNGEPVSHFAWRRVSGPANFLTPNSPYSIVMDDNGLLDLGLGAPNKDGVEVLALDADGNKSGLAAAEVVDFDKPEDSLPVITLAPTGSISGKVQVEDSLLPISGAKVTVRGLLPFPNDLPYDPEPVYTDNNGFFRIDGLTAKSYWLAATYKDYIATEKSTIVHLSPGEELDTTKITFFSKRELIVKVLGRDGKPYEGAKVLARPNTRHDQLAPQFTDSEGRTILNLKSDHSVEITVQISTPQKMSIQETFWSKDDVETEFLIDFSQVVLLTGSVTENGKPYDGRRSLSLVSHKPNARLSSVGLNLDAQSSFKATIKAGDFNLSGQLSPDINQGVFPLEISTFTIQANPMNQHLDIVIPPTVPKIDFRINFPKSRLFRKGYVEIAKQSSTARSGTSVHLPEGQFLELPVGIYTLTYECKDDVWVGESEPFSVDFDSNEVITISPKPRMHRRVLAQLKHAEALDNEALEVDITSSIPAAGSWDVEFMTTFAGAFTVTKAEFLVNGALVSSDVLDENTDRSGVFGNPVFRLMIPELNEGDKVSIRYTAKSRASTRASIWARPISWN